MTIEQFKNSTSEEKIGFLNPLIELALKMLQSGVLKKNIIRHFTNKGLPIEAASDLLEIASLRAEKFSHYKFKTGFNVVAKLDKLPKYLRTRYTGI